MKIKSKILSVFTLCLSLLISCNDNSFDKAIIEKEKGIQEVIKIQDASTLNQMLGNKQSFILLTAEESCLCTTNTKRILNKIVKQKEIRIYEISDIEFYKSSLSSKLVIAAPELTIIKNGDEKITSIHAYEKFEKQINSSNKEESVAPILKYIEKHAYLDSPFYSTTDEALKLKIGNKESFLIYYKRNSCSDCKTFNKMFLDKWILENKEEITIYELDLDLYRNDLEYYQELKDTFGLSVNGNKDFGYLEGVVPSIQKYENGVLTNMAVIYNDQMELTDDNQYKIVDGYYHEFNGQTFETYDDYRTSVTTFYVEKFLEIIKK